MTYAYMVFTLLAGLGVFLLGCTMLSSNMEAVATGKIKDIFYKTSKSKLVGVGIGTLTTMIVQSSSLTTVMVVGLVNTGIIGLAQATTFIIGANIGTTITAQIAALQSFSFSKIAVCLVGVGMFTNIFSKHQRTKTIGNVLTGFGLIFVGLNLMSEAMLVVRQSQVIVDILSKLSNPFLLFFIGILLTAIIQSSSAVTSIVISMYTAGLVIGNGGNSVLFLILGTNVGTCVTAILSSIGATTNAKRASFIHLVFNVLGSVLFFVILLLWPSFMEVTFERMFEHQTTQIAMFHTFFNIVTAIMVLPFTNLLVKLSTICIKDKKEQTKTSLLEKRLLNTPSVALEATRKEIVNLLDLAMDTLNLAIESFVKKDKKSVEKIRFNNTDIGQISKEITNYLVLVSTTLSNKKDEKVVSFFHTSVSDIERIGELADNLAKYTETVIKNNLNFSNSVMDNIYELKDLLNKQKDNVKSMIIDKQYELVHECDKIENEIDAKRKVIINEHLTRLNSGACRAENSSVFMNLINNLERVGDHLYMISEQMMGV